MVDASFIARQADLPPSQDYRLLRDAGLARIRELSGRIWTDHNSHDPGITILELLAYAITDLGYRTGFETRDLLTRPDGLIGPPSETGLFPAHEVLTCAPLTIADHRRLLLRIEGVRNAWLDPMMDPDEPANYRLSETPLYADCAADGLTHSATNAGGQPNHPVRLTGLYRVLVELEIDEALGSLNETALQFTVRQGPLKGVVLAIDSDDPAFHDGSIDFGPDFQQVTAVTSVTGPVSEAFAAVVRVKPAGAPVVVLDQLVIQVVEDRPDPAAPPVSVTLADLEAVLDDNARDGLIGRFWAKQQRRKRALDAVACVLHAHRSLCEDYLSIATVAPFRVGVCADVEVAPDADLEEVQAHIFHEIEKYLSPPVRYRTLDELLADGHGAETIFNGPHVDFDFECDGRKVLTKPGFLLDEDLDATGLRRTVYVSDIINIVADIPGVVAIRNVMLQAYDAAGRPTGASQKWKLSVPPGHQPVLFFEGSKLLLFKNELPFRARPLEFRRTLDHLRALDRQALYVPPDQVLPAVIGRWRTLDAVYSIQHDLPRLYGTGPAGLSIAAPPERVAQARQLKGYLSFFDQVLADYIGQLANVRRLLSPDPTLGQTYFPVYMDGIAGLRADFEDEFYVDKTALQDPVTRLRLTESEETFLDRRNRALDHLIARFAERFADYALMSFRLSGDRLRDGQELIDDKIAFLADYPRISRERSRACNYRPENAADVWDSQNVAGLKRRVSQLLGFDDATRRDLHCAALFDALFATRAAAGAFRLTIPGEGATRLFTSDATFPTAAAALDAGRALFAELRREETFVVDTSGGVGAVTLTLSAGGVALAGQTKYDTEADAVNAARAIVDRYDDLLEGGLCDDEGFHLIEHILLRPRAPADRLMQVCLGEDCDFCGEEDPYSFRISVILPYWPARFRDLDFRRFAERVIREETPAHIHARICWIGNGQMAELDRAYRLWLQALADRDGSPATLRTRAAALIDILERLKTVYPPATLHDCEEGEDDNIVRLGATALGAF